MDKQQWLTIILETLFVCAGVALLTFAAKRFEKFANRADGVLRKLIDPLVRRLIDGFRNLFP